MIDTIAQFFGVIIGYIYLIPNFGAAIVILLFCSSSDLSLNQKQLQSSKDAELTEMRIQQKYKNDKESRTRP